MNSDGVCGNVSGAARALCEIPAGIGGLVVDAGASAFSALSSAMATSAIYFVGRLGAVVSTTTTVDVSSPWFLRQYALMFGLSAFLTLGLLLLSVLKEVVRGQGAAALRAGTVHYLAAVLASAFAPAVVYLLLQLSDGLSAALIAGSGQSTEVFFGLLGGALSGLAVASGPQIGAFTLIVTCLVVIGCVVVLWVELVLRAAIIYVALLFAAPTFSGLVDRSLWRHSRKWLYFTVSIIFAKPLVVAVILLASGAIGGASTRDHLSSVFAGVALLLVAIFCVGLLFRLVPNAGDQIAGALSARREIRAGTPNLPIPSPAVMVRQSLQTHLLQAVRKSATGPVATAAAGGAAGVHRTRTPPPAAGKAGDAS